MATNQTSHTSSLKAQLSVCENARPLGKLQIIELANDITNAIYIASTYEQCTAMHCMSSV